MADLVKTDANRVLIFDTTLRDGEQCPGATMTLDEKVQVAMMLEEMGVDIIEAGFPAASQGDFDAVQKIASIMKRTVVCGLSRAKSEDIDRTAAAIAPAKRRRIHTFIATSPLHMAEKLKMTPEQVLEAVHVSVTRARSHVDDVEWSAEDATQSSRPFLAKCVETAIKAGATTINIPDTCGFTEPQEYLGLLEYLRTYVPGADKVVFSVHCHNDLGMSVANSLYGVRGGARQIECTINGIGERAGNAALEEVVMAMKTREDCFPFWTNIETTMLTRASKLVSAVTSFPVQFNKAIVGRNAFAHESGIHQDGMLKNQRMYEIMRPETVGLKHTSLVLGKHSGRNAFKHKVEELGYKLGGNQIEDAFARFKALADRVKHVTDEDIVAIVDEKIATALDRVKLIHMTAIGSTDAVHVAVVKITIDGAEMHASGEGNGPVNAIFDAIKRLIPHEGHLEDYQTRMIKGSESGSQAETMVQLAIGGRSVSSKGVDPDTLVAAAKAYLGALNKFVARDAVTLPTPLAAE